MFIKKFLALGREAGCHQNLTDWSLGHAEPLKKYHHNPSLTFE